MEAMNKNHWVAGMPRFTESGDCIFDNSKQYTNVINLEDQHSIIVKRGTAPTISRFLSLQISTVYTVNNIIHRMMRDEN